MTRITAAGLVALLAASCAGVWPQVVALDELRAPAVARGEWIDDLQTALASIADIIENELDLPRPRATLYFHRDREAFRLALEANGYGSELAQQTAATLIAVAGHRRVIVNDASQQDLGWPLRVALFAHELTHTLQYEWSGGSRGTSDQWLREGFAEWVEVRVLVALGYTTTAQARRVIIGRLQQAGGAAAFPSLSKMITFPDWVALAQRFEQEAFYGYSMLAVESLIERHGLQDVIAYFELFAGSDDRIANFKRAFGEDLDAFERTAQTRLGR